MSAVSEYEHLLPGQAKERAAGRGGSTELYNVGESRRDFVVRSPNREFDETYALYHESIPAAGSQHPSRIWLYCLRKDAQPLDGDNGELWQVTCSYGLGNGAELPWLEPAIYTISQNATDQICEYDLYTNKPIRNSAGVPFDPPVMASRYEFVLNVSRNERISLAAYTSKARQFTGAVNSSPFYGAAAGFCMCLGIPGSTQYYVDQRGRRTQYFAMSYSFAFRNQFSWQPKILDAGFTKKSESGSLIPITIAGREPSSPVPLNGEGEPLENPETDEPHYLDFKVYPQQNFNALGV